MSQFNLDEWYTLDQALLRLSVNYGRDVDRSLPRQLAKRGQVRVFDLSDRSQLYFREDIDNKMPDPRGRRKPA